MVRDRIDRMYDSVRKVNQAYEIWASAHGLSSYEMQIYYEMIKNGDTAITQKDLCLMLDAPKTSINSIIKKLLQSGSIRMNVNPLNKREKVISFTDTGRKFAEELISQLFRYEEEAAAMINGDEMEAATEVQNRFADILLEKVGQEDE